MFKDRFNLFLRFLKFLRPYRRAWVGIILLYQGTALVSLLNPFLARFAIDEAIAKKDVKLFFAAAGVGVLIFCLNTGFNIFRDLLDRYVRTRVQFDMNRSLFQHVQKLSMRWFQDKTTGEHLYRFDNDLNVVADLAADAMPRVLVLLPKFVLILVILFWMNASVAFLTLCLVPLYLLPPYYFSRRMEGVFSQVTDQAESLLKGLEEYFSHIRFIKVFGREPQARRWYATQLIRLIRLRLKSVKFEVASGLAMEVANKIVVGLMMLYGGVLVIRGHVTLGTWAAITVYFYQLVELQGEAGSFFETINTGFVSCQRVAGVLDELPEIVDIPGARDLIFEKGDIVFENVTFGYRSEHPVLKNLRFGIEAGRHIALVGPSGCGKTTLLNLLVRLYDPWSGRILIDGFDTKELRQACLKRQIGFVLQEPFLWNDTVENNIRLGRDKATSSEIAAVAKRTGVDEIVRELRDGYATVIGENAGKLSEGQKQKIAIARALIKDPRILILDEAMSMMDSASEDKILSALKKSYPSITLITVSHRLSTAMAADVVYYFAAADTMIVDQAKNLFEKDTRFAKLFTGQDKIFV
jgi:ABC-type multidrug transport system fused ATPase/permease subunit